MGRLLSLAALALAGVAFRRTIKMSDSVNQINEQLRELDSHIQNVAGDIDRTIEELNRIQGELGNSSGDKAEINRLQNELANVATGLRERVAALRTVSEKVPEQQGSDSGSEGSDSGSEGSDSEGSDSGSDSESSDSGSESGSGS